MEQEIKTKRTTVDGFLYEGFLYELFDNARKHTEKRHTEKHKEIFDITLDHLKSLWNKQEGKCFYSKVPMSTKFDSDWQCSIERLNLTLSYTKGNVALVCKEFNSDHCRDSGGWNQEKVKIFLKSIKRKYNM